MRKKLFLILMATPFLFPSFSPGAEQIERLTLTYATTHGGLKAVIPPETANAPRLGIALAGGGARAAASIGVLKVLAREGIPVSAVAGTSMGAIVGGLYAAGYHPDELERIFVENDWNDIFRDTPARMFLTPEQKKTGSKHLVEFRLTDARIMPPTGLSAGQKLANLLMAKTLAASCQAEQDFNRLPIPFRAVAADLETGDMVVLDHGILHDAIRASAAIPLAFQPVEYQGRLLVDGGLVNNLPVDVVESMQIDTVLAVDSSARPERREWLTTFFEIMGQSITLQVQRASKLQAARADLVITPDTSAYSFTDFPRMAEIIAIGEQAAREALPSLRAILLPKQRAAMRDERLRIVEITITGNTLIPDETIRSIVRPLLSASETSTADLRSILAKVYNLGVFDEVMMQLQGYYDAVRAELVVWEHPLLQVVRVTGNSLIPSREIIGAFDDQIGRPFNAVRAMTILDGIVKRYREKGFLLVHVAHTAIRPDGTLEVQLYEGRVDSISLTGQEKTKHTLIKREIATKIGRPLNFMTIGKDVQHLYGLDYFSSVTIDPGVNDRGGMDLTFKIKEKPSTKVRLGLRYDLEDSFTGLTDILMDNATGRGIKLYANARYGTYSDLTIGYYSPVILRTNFMHRIESFYRQRDYIIYENKEKIEQLETLRTGIDVSFGYQWFHFGDTYLRYRYAEDRTQPSFGTLAAREKSHLGSWAFITTIDTRDSDDFPHRGLLLRGSYEAATESWGSDREFTKTAISAQGALPLAERHTFVFDVSAGLGSGALPYIEQFGIGGIDHLLGAPLPGYYRREFVGNNELGFLAAYRWKFKEYQLSAVKSLFLGISAGAANVWERRDDLSWRDLRGGAGIGLYADTIVGPVKLDIAAGEDDRKIIYFSAGFDF